MHKKSILIIFFCILLFAVLICAFIKTYPQFNKYPEHINPDVSVKHSSHMDESKYFVEAFGQGEKYLKIEKNKVYGGIVPHHLLAGALIASFFEGIKDQEVKKIILISPDHFMAGKYNISSSKGKFTTLFGDLNPDLDSINYLEQNKAVFIDEEIFEKEHGIYGLTPFIKAIFPDSIFIPIAIKGGTKSDELDNLANELNKIADENTIIIVSSDFSHYVPNAEADKYDKESISAIESFDLDKVIHLHPTKNTDSPESIYTLLKIMQLKNASNLKLLVNSNSVKLTNNVDSSDTTSYVTMYFTKDKD